MARRPDRVNFATPIAHQETGDYSSFDHALAIGRPFRQPLLTAPDPDKHSPGLEVLLSESGRVASFYSWLDGILRVEPATAGRASRLVLGKRVYAAGDKR
jgi:hypothetical protein